MGDDVLARHLAAREEAKQGGLDQWSTAEAKRLPAALLRPLVQLFGHIECEPRAKWPEPLNEVPVAQIPKTNDEFRPIALQSVWINAWYSIRFKQCDVWQQSVLPCALQGGIRGRSTFGAEYLPAALMQEASHDKCEMIGLTHDRRKCFNHIKAELAAAVLKALGLDHTVVDAYLKRYQVLGRRFRFGRAYGPHVHYSSVLEGCS